MRKKVAQDIGRELLRAIANLVRTYKEIDERLQARVDKAGLEQKKSIMDQIKDLEERAEVIEDPQVYRKIKTEVARLDDRKSADYFISESGIRIVKADEQP
jgi:NAD(P)H-nitrite reductase large subunit